MKITEIALQNQNSAWQVIESTHLMEIWESMGAEIHLVGSLRSGLLMKNLDIDFHIYTPEVNIKDSFLAIQTLAQNPSVRKVQYKNLLVTEEECIEWNVWYQDHNFRLWQLDMIHFRKESLYDGWVEKVTDRIIQVLTPELKEIILQLKFDIPDDWKVPGIQVYKAVIADGIRTYPEFVEWQKEHVADNFLAWIPI
ncbi:MAG: nucleotidyltransferase domain-containing protein [Bacteroides sp.]|nr:nucleotidyltransferase domain-containing protein [Bacteroides sp.]